MSYLTAGQQDWRAGSGRALLFASVSGPATTLACFGGFFVWAMRDAVMSDQQFTLGYRIGAGLTVLIEFLGLLIPMAAVCAVGLAIFGLPVSRRFGEDLIACWTVILALLWGGLSGGILWVVLSALFSDWQFGGQSLFLIGAAFGSPTGFWWWFFYRRVLVRRAALAD